MSKSKDIPTIFINPEEDWQDYWKHSRGDKKAALSICNKKARIVIGKITRWLVAEIMLLL